MTVRPIPTILRWTARAASLAYIGLILMFAFGERGTEPITLRQWIGIAFFPVGVGVGLLLAWWREAAGAGVAIASLACFYGIFGLILSGAAPGGPWFLILSSPALLFLGSSLAHRRTGL